MASSKFFCVKGIFYFFIVFLFSSCINTKKTNTIIVPKGQELSHTESVAAAAGHYKTTFYTNPKKILAKLKNDPSDSKTKTIIFQPLTTDKNKLEKKEKNKAENYPQVDNAGEYSFYSEPQANNSDSYTGLNLKSGTKFRFNLNEPIFQALTIPIKLRPSLGEENLKSTASASFNVAFSYGRKFTYKTYSQQFLYDDSDKEISSASSIQAFTLIPGFFLGPTVVSLDSSNTAGHIKPSQSVVGGSLGGFTIIGLNSFNIGVAVGCDFVFGRQPSNWDYNAKPWLGLIVGIDLFK